MGHPISDSHSTPSDADVLALTQAWLEKAVIGLNLCPFAKAVHAQGQIHYVVSRADDPETLLLELRREILNLAANDPIAVDTSLIIHPGTLNDFRDFIDFTGLADDLIDELELTDEIQIATFHPDYQFAGSKPGDIDNYTNRSPYPTLQLLREASVGRAIDRYGDTAQIFEKNIQTLRKLGLKGWEKLNDPSEK